MLSTFFRAPRRNFPAKPSFHRRLPPGCYGCASQIPKIAKFPMFEMMVGVMRSRLQSSPSHWGLPQSCTEGFWSEIRPARISWSWWYTLKMFTRSKFQYLDQNRPKSRFQSKFQNFLRFDGGKLLHTFSTSTGLHMRCSVHLLYRHSPHNVRKTTKNNENALGKGY